MSVDEKKLRKKFRESVFARDEHTCRACGACSLSDPKVVLNAHHITPREEMPKGGYVVENGITLCEDGCHAAAERALRIHKILLANKNYKAPFCALSPPTLYSMINSSRLRAESASEKLK